MTCQVCGTENRPGRRFCAQCGAPLSLRCPSCGADNEPGERFCGECGTSLAPIGAATGATSARVGEAAARRVVSVLFVDLVGFTAMSEGRDPEDVREVLDAYVATARRIVGNYGGVVEKFIGDAVMAVFGTPRAHEDDAERAVRAALDIVSAVGTLTVRGRPAGLQARGGVLTGETAVDLEAQGQGMVTGDVVNTAARLQGVAEPGVVLVGDETRAATGEAIEYEPAGRHIVKGKTLPVNAWRAMRPTRRRRGTTLEPPFVGRDRELRQLVDALEAVAEESRARVVSVVGVAGIGKSRLARELQRYVAGLPEVVYWHEGRCPAYGQGVTFWALGEMVRMRVGLREDDDPMATRAAIARTLAALSDDEAEREWLQGALEVLLAAADAAAPAGSDHHAAWRRFFELVAARGPTVLVVEDLHAADDAMVTFLEQLLGWSRRSPILVVTLARPELADRHPQWGSGVHNATSMHLEPLPEPAMRALLAGLVPSLSEELTSAVLSRAEGVPLYAVETVRALLDSDPASLSGTQLELPQTLTALVSSRIDALPDEERSALRAASVLGRSFRAEALAHVLACSDQEVAALLDRLIRRDLILVESDPRSPERGQYVFVQGMLREVAAHTLSRRDLRALHLAAAEFFARDADPSLASIVAHHYVEAARADPWAPDSNDLAEHARSSLLAAADRAKELGALPQAVTLVEEALTFTEDKQAAAGLHVLAAELALPAALYGRAMEHGRDALEAYGALGRPDDVARATAMLGLGGGGGESSATPTELADRFHVLEGAASDEPLGFLAGVIATRYALGGDPFPALEWSERCLSLAGPADDVQSLVSGFIARGIATNQQSRTREAAAVMLTAADLAEKAGLVTPQLVASSNAIDALMLLDPHTAVDVGRRTVELARRLGHRTTEVTAGVNAAWAAIQAGDWRTGRELIEALEEGPPSDLDRMVQTSRMLVDLLTRGEATPSSVTAIATGFSDDLWDLQFVDDLRNLDAMSRALAGEPIPERWWERGPHVLVGETLGAHLIVGHVALWRRAAEVAEEEAAQVAATRLPGALARIGVRCLRAGVRALSGDVAGATSEYDRIVADYRETGLEFHRALALVDRALLLDDTAAAVEADAILSDLGAEPFLRWLRRER